jgi:alkylhydroperoxidase/carboxymuconolactone decarboxylase family protein YurZ
MTEVTREAEQTLRGVSMGDAPLLERLLAMQLDNLEVSGLDPRTYSLVKIATLIAIDAPPASYVAQVAFAAEAGVTADEIIGVLVAAAPQVGIPKVVAAAPEIMLALDLSLDEEE